MTTDYEDAVAVGDLSVRLLRPSEPEELFAVAAEARGDAPYHLRFSGRFLVILTHF